MLYVKPRFLYVTPRFPRYCVLRSHSAARHRSFTELPRWEGRAGKRYDLSIAPYVKLHFTWDPLVMDPSCVRLFQVAVAERLPVLGHTAHPRASRRVRELAAEVIGVA